MNAKRLLVAWAVLSLSSPAWAQRTNAAARRSYDYALEQYLNGNFKRALSEINTAIADDQDLTGAYALRARIWAVYGDLENMRRDCNTVVKKLVPFGSSLDMEQLVAQGTALQLTGAADAAMPSYDAALQLNARNPEALAGRARAWRSKGLNARALDDLNELLKSGRGSTIYYYSRANVFYDLGQYDNALADATLALRQNKNFYPAYGLVGASLARKGDTKRALKAYGKALSVNPDYAFAYLGKAAVELAGSSEQAAFGDFAEAIRAAPHDYAPYFNRAEAYWRRGNREEAMDDYRKALSAVSMEPDFVIQIGDRFAQMVLYEEAIEAYTRAYELAGGGKSSEKNRARLSNAAVRALVRRAAAYEGQRDLKSAMADLSEAVDREPSFAPAWSARGTLALKMGLDEQALGDLNQAVRLDPKNAEVRVSRGSYFARIGRPKAAMEDFNGAIMLDAGRADAYNDRGTLYSNSFNQPEKALADIEKAVSLAPRDANFLFNLAMLRLKLKDYWKAIEHFNEALKFQGPPARILTHRAEAYAQLGDHANALADIQTALEKDPKAGQLYDALGSLRMRARDYEQAVRDLGQALDLDPENVSALIHRGQAYGALGTLKRAVKDFRRAVDVDSRSKEALTAYCQALRLDGDAADAVNQCSKAIDVDGYYASAYLQRGLGYLALHKADKAIEDINTASELGLRRGEGYLAMAIAHAASRLYEEAHHDYLTAMRYQPGAHSAEIALRYPHGDSEEFFNAIADLDPLMRRDSTKPYVFVVRGDALLNAEHFDKAVSEYTKALEIDGSVADAYLGRAAALMGQESYDSAEQDLRRVLELRANDAATHVLLATLLTYKRDYREAAAEAAKAVRLDKTSSEAYLRAGNAHYFLKDYKKALENYELSVKADPSNAAAHNAVGLGHFALHQYDTALESFSRAIALDPNSDRFYRNRASTYSNMRSFVNAAAEFKNASAVNTDPAMAEDYKKLIDQAESQSATGGKG